MLPLRAFSSMQIDINALSLSFRFGTFLTCSKHLGQFHPQRSHKKEDVFRFNPN